jgi:release factor glutamine methyltransferase
MNALAMTTPRSEPTVGEAIATATRRLQQMQIATARLDAEVLLAHVCATTRSRLLATVREPLPATAVIAFEAVLARRARREPIAYIVGHQEFWSIDFEVTPAVLIPRPETELLVETALRLLGAVARPRIADIGTGSGCIAIALARELSGAELWAVDLSPAALRLAQRNAERLGVAARVRFAVGDLVAPLAAGAPFDAICSNPPYVAVTDAVGLPPELRYEPSDALFAGTDGLAIVRRLLDAAPELLAPDGVLLVEIGFGQAAAVRQLAAAVFASVEIRDDYAGIARLLIARGRR